MIRGRIHRVLVTRDRQVVGIVTSLDMLRVIQQHAAEARQAQRRVRVAG